MTFLIDIACPRCDSPHAVQKVALDEYRCTDCDYTFGVREVLPDG